MNSIDERQRGPDRRPESARSAGSASVNVLDTTGRRVRTLGGFAWDIGEHAVAWDGRDDAGHRVRSGLFVVHVRAVGGDSRARILVLR